MFFPVIQNTPYVLQARSLTGSYATVTPVNRVKVGSGERLGDAEYLARNRNFIQRLQVCLRYLQCRTSHFCSCIFLFHRNIFEARIVATNVTGSVTETPEELM